MGEAINLVNNFKVEKVIFNCGEFNELEQDLIKDDRSIINRMNDLINLNRDEYFYLPGKILHIDADKDYLDRWDYEKNKKMPSIIPKGSHTKIWLKCERDIHESEQYLPHSITQGLVQCNCASVLFLIINF